MYIFLVQHKQHMKEYRQKLAKTREKSDIRTEEDLVKRLDELELEEELEDEIYRLSVNEVLLYTKQLHLYCLQLYNFTDWKLNEKNSMVMI